MALNLVKPIIFFDLETTGVDISKDRIVEISFIKVFPDGREMEYSKRINPEMHIPEGASAVHGIYDEDVKECPTFKEVARVIANEFEGCDVAGFNSNRFDLPLLAEEFLRAQVDIDLSRLRAVDVQVLYHKREPRTLSAAHRYYCGEDFDNAHSALADTRATYNVLKAMVEHYDDMPGDVEALSKESSFTNNVDFAGRFVYDAEGRELFNFGKYKGMPVDAVLDRDPSYYGWMMNGDFPLNTKQVLTRIKLRGLKK